LPWAAQCRFFVNRQEKVSGIVSEHGRHDLADRRGFLSQRAALRRGPFAQLLPLAWLEGALLRRCPGQTQREPGQRFLMFRA
jgi:hypothetical protein